MVLPTNLGGRSAFCSAGCLCNGEQWRALLSRRGFLTATASPPPVNDPAAAQPSRDKDRSLPFTSYAATFHVDLSAIAIAAKVASSSVLPLLATA